MRPILPYLNKSVNTVPFEINNKWFNGKCDITTYALDELMGTKLRALYQRKKGRGLPNAYDPRIRIVNVRSEGYKLLVNE